MRRLFAVFVLLACSVALATTADQRDRSTNAVAPSASPFSRPMENYSPDGTELVIEAVRDGEACEQVYVGNADGSAVRMVSSGKGSASGASFFPDGKQVIYSETAACPATPRDVLTFRNSDLFVVNADGTGRRQLTHNSGYNGEASVSPDGGTIVFTSTRQGNPSLYSMNVDGSNVRRLTDELGYDGSPLFSPDGQWIAYRAYYPQTPQGAASYRNSLKQHQLKLNGTQLWIMHADGTAKRQLTNHAAEFAPYFSADSKRVVFGTKFGDSGGSEQVDLYSFRLDGTSLERITQNYMSPDDLARKERNEDKYDVSMANRKKLREPLAFGFLKVISYLFAAVALTLFLFKVGLVAFPALRKAAISAEEWLQRISSRAVRTSADAHRDEKTPSASEERRAHSTTLQRR